MEQLVLIQEQEHNQGKALLKSGDLIRSSVDANSNSSTLSGLSNSETGQYNQDLEQALFLSASYFSTKPLKAYNEAAFYTITTQGLAICEVRKNVNYRLRLLHNLALYYYTKAAPNLKHLKRLEDVLELSPKQCSIATYYNNLAFMRLSANILCAENPEHLSPFETKYSNEDLAPVFTTAEIELLLATNKLEQAAELNEHFMQQASSHKKAVCDAYYYLHNYLIHQASGNYAKARTHIEQALEAFNKTKCYPTLTTCHRYLSELYEDLGYYTQALEHIKLANHFETKTKSAQINLSELERLHSLFRKKILSKKPKTQNLN